MLAFERGCAWHVGLVATVNPETRFLVYSRGTGSTGRGWLDADYRREWVDAAARRFPGLKDRVETIAGGLEEGSFKNPAVVQQIRQGLSSILSRLTNDRRACATIAQATGSPAGRCSGVAQLAPAPPRSLAIDEVVRRLLRATAISTGVETFKGVPMEHFRFSGHSSGWERGPMTHRAPKENGRGQSSTCVAGRKESASPKPGHCLRQPYTSKLRSSMRSRPKVSLVIPSENHVSVRPTP